MDSTTISWGKDYEVCAKVKSTDKQMWYREDGLLKDIRWKDERERRVIGGGIILEIKDILCLDNRGFLIDDLFYIHELFFRSLALQ